MQEYSSTARNNENEDNDDDEINMSELEELMDEITLEEEIDDEISFMQVQTSSAAHHADNCAKR